MNFRQNSILDSLMKGSEVPQPDWYYFLEIEWITPERYTRKWFYLDNMCQRNHDHIPKTTNMRDGIIVKRVKKTRNPNLPRLLYQKIETAHYGLVVEFD